MSNEIDIQLDDELDLQEPKKYKVFLLNDDYSTMDFVIDVLVKVFRKSLDESSAIMLNIHNNGREICGVVTCKKYLWVFGGCAPKKVDSIERVSLDTGGAFEQISIKN